MKISFIYLLLTIVVPGLALPRICASEMTHADHSHVKHDNIDDEPVAQHAHTHRHSPDEPEHSHDHSHQLPNSPSLDSYSIVYTQGIALLAPPVVKVDFQTDIFDLSNGALSSIFRPPIA